MPVSKLALARGRPLATLVVAAASTVLLGACGGRSAVPPLPQQPAPQVLRWHGGARAQLTRPPGGARSKALVILIHGGGWTGLDPRAYAALKPAAQAYQRLGFATLVVDYRGGALGVGDVNHFYERVRARVGRHVPICAVGGSAGGHIALMLAVLHPDLDCAISLAGPTDLEAFAENQTPGFREIIARFGAGRLTEFSPLRRAKRIHARLLLVYARNDPIVPVSQAVALARATRRSRLVILPPGGAPFVHSRVSGPARDRVDREEQQFLARAVAKAR